MPFLLFVGLVFTPPGGLIAPEISIVASPNVSNIPTTSSPHDRINTNRLSQKFNNSRNRKVIVEYTLLPALRRINISQPKQVKNKNIRGKIQTVRSRIRQVHERLADDLRQLNQNFGKQKISSTEPSIGHRYSLIYSGAAVTLDESLIPDVESLNYVKEVHRDYRFKIVSDSIRKMIGALKLANDLNVTGNGVDVAIMDTGVDYMHEALGGGIGEDYKVKGGYDFINLDRDPMDDHGHGTKIASVIAADGKHKGIAPKANLYAYKVMNSEGTGLASDILQGMERAVNRGVDVINMSLGGPGGTNSPLAKGTNNAVRAGVVVVAAAGNNGDSYWSVQTPGVAEGAITVGATDRWDNVAEFSSRGPTPKSYEIKPDIVAPGVDVLSADVGGGYSGDSGTSLAAPVVAGAATLLRELYPDRLPKHIKSMLVHSALDLNADIWSQGHGRVRVDKAYQRDVTSFPSQISFGLMPKNYGTWSGKDTLTFYNLSERQKSFDIQSAVSQQGVDLSFNQNEILLNPGDSSRIIFTATVNNEIAGFPANRPLDFGGDIVALNNEDTLRIPWAVIKIPHLTIRTEFKGSVHLHAHKKDKGGDTKSTDFYSSGDPENITWRFFDNTSYNIIAEFIRNRNNTYNIVIKEGIDIAKQDTLQILPREAIHEIKIEPYDERGILLDNYDALVSLRRLVHKTGFRFTRGVGADIIKTSTINDEYQFEGYNYFRFYRSETEIHDYINSHFVFNGIHSDKLVTNEPRDYHSVSYRIPKANDFSNVNLSIRNNFKPNLLSPAPFYIRHKDLPKTITLHFLRDKLSPLYRGYNVHNKALIFESARHRFGPADSISFNRGGYRYRWHSDDLAPISMNHVLPFFSAGINSEMIWTGKDKGFYHDAFGGIAGLPSEPIMDVYVQLHRDGSVIYEERVPEGQFKKTSVRFPAPQKDDVLDVSLEKDNYFVEGKSSKLTTRYHFGGKNSGTGPKISELRLTADDKYRNVISFKSENKLLLKVNQRYDTIDEMMEPYNEVDSIYVRYRESDTEDRWKVLDRTRSNEKIITRISGLSTAYYDLKIDIYDNKGNKLEYRVSPAFKYISPNRKITLESSEQAENANFSVALSSLDSLGYESIDEIDFQLTYTDSLLDFQGVQLSGELASQAKYRVTEKDGGALDVDIDSHQPIKARGKLMSFGFRTRNISGESPLKIENFSFSDKKLNVITEDGQVQISPIILGDVSDSREITAYDASRILQYTHGVQELTELEKLAANVGGSQWITSQDAILVLRHVIDQIARFPTASKQTTIIDQPDKTVFKSQSEKDKPGIYFGETSLRELAGNTPADLLMKIPLNLRDLEGVRSLETELTFYSDNIELRDIEFKLKSPWLGRYNFDEENHRLQLAAAGPSKIDDKELAVLTFRVDNQSSDTTALDVEGTARINEKSPEHIPRAKLINFPESVILKQNYPNPFNPVTTIKYGILEQTHVRLDVYNIQGKRVATLVNGSKKPGMHSVKFNGSHLASGVYFYTLQTQLGSRTKKFILMK